MINHRLVVVAIVLAVTAGLAVGATRLVVDITNDSFVDNDSPSKLALNQFRADFGREELFILVIDGPVFSTRYLEKLEALHGEVATLKVDAAHVEKQEQAADDPFADFEGSTEWEGGGGTVVEETTSLINARRTRDEDDDLEVSGWFEPVPDEKEIAARAVLIENSQNVARRLVSRDGKRSIVVVRTRVMKEQDSHKVYDALVALARKHAGPEFAIAVSGIPATIVNVLRATEGDTMRFLGLGIALMIIVLVVIFRHPIGVVGPLLVGVVSIVWTVGFMGAAGLPFTVITNILPLVILAVAMSDSIHVQSIYRDLRAEGMSNRDAIVAAIGTTGPPCLLTSITTALGLLSFYFASLGSIREMGIAGAVGVMFAFTSSMVILPIMLTLVRSGAMGRSEDGGPDRLDKLLGKFLRVATARPGIVLCAGLSVTVAAGVLAATQLSLHNDPIEWLPDDNRSKVASEVINETVTGISTINLMVTTELENGVKSLALLEALTKVEQRVLAYEQPGLEKLVTHSSSLLDAVRETHRAIKGGGEDAYRIPADQGVVFDLLFLFEAADRDQMARLVTADFKRMHLSFNVRWEGPPLTDGLIAHVGKVIDEEVDSKLAQVVPTGTIYTFNSVVSNLLYDLVRTFGVAFLAIALVLLVLFRNLKLALIAMIPNVVPVVVVLGGMAVLDVPLDLVTVLAGSIVLGLAVDDTVHFFHHFNVEYRRTGDPAAAIKVSLNRAGRAIVITTLVMTLGFLMYGSAQLSAMVALGLIVSGALVVALVFDLVVGPALLGIAFTRKSRHDVETNA